jgi:hypothetical protein
MDECEQRTRKTAAGQNSKGHDARFFGLNFIPTAFMIN